MRRWFCQRASRMRNLYILVAILALLSAGHAGHLVITSNFHTVIDGKLYRSARPSPEDIAKWHEQYNIRTIVNLMGASPRSAWYRQEQDAATRYGIKLIDYKLSAHDDLTDQEIADLFQILAGSEGPILIHCYRGADRTSLVAAMYVAAIAHRSEIAAEWQLTPLYGYVPLWFLPAFAMYRSWERVEVRLGILNS